MDEKFIYTGLVKGANIGSLTNSDKYAETQSRLLKSDNRGVEKLDELYFNTISRYGVLLEEEQEEELRELINSKNVKELITYLENLESEYQEYFIDLVSERRKRVERIYEEISQRTKFFIKDEEIIEIKKAESHRNYNTLVNLYKYVKSIENKCINKLYQETKDSVSHYVQNNKGDLYDAEETWLIASTEFRNKLKKEPGKGYYAWRPVDTDGELKTSLKTFFIHICKMRWLDELRRRKKRPSSNEDYIEYADNVDNDLLEFYERQDLRYRMKRAISKLDKTCREIIEGKFYGGDDEDGLDNIELAKVINLTVGYIKNRNKSCLEELRIQFEKENLN